MSILVSGTTGFVGKHLIAYLNVKFPNQQIFHLNRLKTNSETGITWEQITQNNMPAISSIVHLAGMAHDTKNNTNEHVYFEVNTELTVKLFKSFLASHANQFIYISSVKAVADQVETLLKEDMHPSPQTAYGRSKLAAETQITELLTAYLAKHPTSNKKLYILRPCMIHGPGNKGNLNLLYNFIQKGLPYPLAAFNNKRSFLSIFNLVYVIGKLIESHIPSGVYHIADDDYLSTNQLIDTIAEMNKKKVFKLYIPQKLVRAIFKFFDVINFPIQTEQLNKMVENYQVSNEKILRELNLKLPVSSIDGLKITINSFKK